MQPCKWQFEWYSGGSAWLGTTDSEARGVEGWRWWQTGSGGGGGSGNPFAAFIGGERHERTLIVVGGLCTWR